MRLDPVGECADDEDEAEALPVRSTLSGDSVEARAFAAAFREVWVEDAVAAESIEPMSVNLASVPASLSSFSEIIGKPRS